jgi:hypothetical protein
MLLNHGAYHDAGITSGQLVALELLLSRNKSIHWISLNEETGIYEMFLDNSIMSSYRSCPQSFIYAWVEGYQSLGRSWILDFGSVFHKMIEKYYQTFRNPDFDLAQWAVVDGLQAWNEYGMYAHSHVKEFTTVGGARGFCTLLAAYGARFSSDNERLRIIGTEIPFGKKKEVPLGHVTSAISGIPFLDCYLSGRIDVLVDDRDSICPLDHKTKGTLRNDPSKSYEMDEGPTGYIYAVSKIVPALIAELGLGEELLKRRCNKILMNYVSKAPLPDPNERFRRLPILKTQYQLEEYRKRMLVAAEGIFRTLLNHATGATVSRDTSKCTMMYGSDCPYIAIDRQGSRENELIVINSAFKTGPIWNTEKA